MSSPARLAAVGVPVTALGALGFFTMLRDVLAETQGKCDYRPCVTSTTVPLLLAGMALLAVGVFILGVAAGRLRSSV
jgi:hypothetical protein